MRLADQEDLPDIVKCLRWVKKHSPSAKMQNIDDAKCITHVEDRIKEGKVLIAYGCMIMFDTGTDWFSYEKGMFEEMFMSMNYKHGHDIPKAIDFLIRYAENIGCKYIAVGDTQIGLMAPYYMNSGFSPSGSQLYRRI
jgi:hypothetical protein